MAYLTYEEYKTILESSALAEDDFNLYEIYAEAVVDAYTFGIIGKQSLMSDSVYSQKIKKATAFQIDAMYRDSESFLGEGSRQVVSRSTSVGGISESVSYDTSANNGATIVGGMKICPFTANLLSPIKAMGRIMA